MKKFKGIFAVSFIAMMTVGIANANIASQGYVDQEVGTRLSAISGSTGGTGNVVTSVTASGGTVTATKGITAEEKKFKVTTVRATDDAEDKFYPSEKAVATALAAKANTADLAEVATSGSYNDLADKPSIPSAYTLPAATATALGGVKSGGDITVATDGTVTVNSATNADKATTATTATNATNATNATKALQDAEGNVITKFYATNTALDGVSEAVTAAQTAAEAAQEAADAAKSAAATAQSTATAAQSAAATAQTTANAKVSTAQGPGNENKAVITNASGNITTGTITSAMITDGTITNADISSSAAIAQSKISGLSTSLAAKANTADLAEVATSGSYNDLADKPSIPSAYTLPAATSAALGGVKSGGDITVATDGTVTVNSATNADKATTATTATNATNATNATKASQDAEGNVITEFYATNTALAAKQNASTAVEVASAGTAVGSATKPVYVDNTGVVRAANTIPTTTSELENDSGFLTSVSAASSGTGAVVTGISASGGKVTATKGNVKIPVGGESATTYASIWVE